MVVILRCPDVNIVEMAFRSVDGSLGVLLDIRQTFGDLIARNLQDNPRSREL